MEDKHASLIAGASSGLRRAAIGLGAEAIALLEVAGYRVEVTWLLGRSRELPLQSGRLLADAFGGSAFFDAPLVLSAGTRLAILLRDTVSEYSQSFLLFPWQNGEKVVIGVIGFTEVSPPVSEVPDAVVESLNFLGWAKWSAKEITRLRDELRTVNERLAGRKLVERAKSTLQAERSISEEQAYQYLRSLSRKRRITLAELSAEILGGRGRAELLPAKSRESTA